MYLHIILKCVVIILNKYKLNNLNFNCKQILRKSINNNNSEIIILYATNTPTKTIIQKSPFSDSVKV